MACAVIVTLKKDIVMRFAFDPDKNQILESLADEIRMGFHDNEIMIRKVLDKPKET